MKYFFFITTFFFCQYANAQNKTGELLDKTTAKKYWDSAKIIDLSSMKRQLLLDSALMFDPTNAYYWQQKGMPLFKQQKYELGLPYLDSAVKYDRRRWLPYRAFMKSMFQRSYRNAIEDFNAAKQIDCLAYEMDHPYDFYLSLCYLQLNDFETADFFLTKCIKEREAKFGNKVVHYLHHFYKGVIQMEKEEYENAINSFDVCLKIYPQFSDGKYYKAKCFIKQNNYTTALNILKEAKNNFDQGYTITEDNVIYERYPYQLRPKWIEGMIRWLEKR